MTDTIQEIPLTEAPEQPQSEEIPDPDISLEAPPPPPLVRAKSKAASKARGKRGPDKKPRAKPAPRAKVISPIVEPPVESESEESVDEATMQELHTLSLLRSIRAYDQGRRSRKEQLYASWFNR